ncbi:MAG: TetR/AcrR family transcriptional regulator [Acidobacteria bacterium]|nr:TetR/AcrR family transcriptional regulator [Acidobacteriota bacterium]
MEKTRTLPTLGTALEEGRMSSEVRRQQLIRVAISLFSKKGFRGTTTKEIAHAAGVTEAMIFRHFPTKDDLYSAILDYKANQLEFAQWLKELREHAERRDDEALFRAFFTKLVNYHCSDGDMIRLMLYSALEGHSLAQKFHDKRGNTIQKFLRDYILMRQREGAFHNLNVNAVVCSCFAMPTNHSMARNLFQFRNMEVPADEAIATFTQLLLSGLRQKPTSKKTSRKSSRKKSE